MSDKPEGFNIFLIALSVLTIIELLILKFALADDSILLMVSLSFHSFFYGYMLSVLSSNVMSGIVTS